MNDSSADLLFRISADAKPAQADMAVLRQSLATDLGAMGKQFDDFSARSMGSLDALRGKMLGMVAIGAGLGASFAGAMLSAAEKTAKFAEEIEDLGDRTGITAERASKLRFAAEQTGAEWGKFSNSLVFFEIAATKALNGNDRLLASFRAIGITERDLRAGMTDLVPLLYQASDGLRNVGSKAEQATVGTALFGRGFRDLTEVLTLGSRNLELFGERAAKLGRVLTEENVVAAKAFKMASKELRAELDGLWFSISNSGMPVLRQLAAFAIATIELLKKPDIGFIAGMVNPALGGSSFAPMLKQFIETKRSLDETLNAAISGAGSGRANFGVDEPAVSRVKEAKREYSGLSSILEQVLGQLAKSEGPEQAMINTIRHLQAEIQKAGLELGKLRSEGKLTAESWARESAVMIELPGKLAKLAASLQHEIREKQRIDAEQATTDLQQRLNALAEQDWASRRRELERELGELRLQYEKKKQLTQQNEELISQIRHYSLARIMRDQSAEYQRELVDLQQHLAQMVTARMTTGERLAYQYQQDLQRLSEVEQARRSKSAGTPGELATLEEQAALNRDALLQKYGQDVVALQNSQGWQGLFGSRFAELLRHNESALREWATSADQAFNLVGQSANALQGLSQKAFGALGQGMGANIAHALIYSKTIRGAMRESLAATAESIAGESLIQAIYSGALGFLRLAQHNYPAAAAAFQAAALFGAVGGAAAFAGRAIAPHQEAASSSAASGPVGTEPGASGSSAGSGDRRSVTVVLNGNIYGRHGIEEVAELLNEYVMERDGTLYSTQARRTGGATA